MTAHNTTSTNSNAARDLEPITRPDTNPIKLMGNYYTQGGNVYEKNGNVIAVDKLGYLSLTSDEGQIKVHLAWILFNTYPEFYGFNSEFHDQVNHIDGDHTNNEAWNFRPVTAAQNSMLYHKPE